MKSSLFYRKNGKPVNTPSKKKVSKKPSKALIKTIQGVVNKNLEDKMCYKSQNDINYNSGIDSIGDVSFIFPNISQGTSDSARIGDQLRTKNFRVQGHIITNLTFNTYNSCRIGVRLMVVQPKNYGSQTLISNGAATWLAGLLKKGGTTTNFSGLVSDLYAPINSDYITTYYDKLFYMQSPYWTSSAGPLNVQSMTKFFDMKFKVKNKLIRYDTGVDSGVTPLEYNPCLIIGYAKLDSASPDTVSTQINLSYVSTVTYQDA